MRQVKIWYDDDSATYSAEIRDDNGLNEHKVSDVTLANIGVSKYDNIS